MRKNLAALSSLSSFSSFLSLLSLWSQCSRQYAAGVFIAGCLLVIPSNECVAQHKHFVDQLFPEDWREQRNARLASAISNLDDHLALSDQQIAKIRMAGELDIERFIRDRERIRNETEALQIEFRGNVQELLQAVSPLLQRLYRKFFDDDSLFAKTIRTTLSPEQRETEFGRELLNRDLVFHGMILCRKQPEPSELEKRIRLIELHAQETNRREAQRGP